MENTSQKAQEKEPSGDRLSRLSQASLRINESLDFDTVLQEVLDSARSLTSATYGVMTLLDEEGTVQDFLSSGMTADEAERLWLTPDKWRLFEGLTGISEPIRVPDLVEHVRDLGLADFTIPLPVGVFRFMAAPMFHRGVRVGHVFVGDREGGEEFTREDEETLVMFASQAAQVIANARTHRDERRARTGLETLIDTSPVGVAVFDINARATVSFNRETRRIVEGLRSPGQTPEDLMELITVRRADGHEVSLQEFPITRVLSSSETVRAEEIVLGVPDGRSVTVLLNATPIRSEEGEVESVVVTMQDLAGIEEMERLRAEFLAMVSHELRMPLTSIRGAATALLDAATDLDPAEMRQFHRIIIDRADHMRELIGDLLDVASIETGTLSVDPEPSEVGALVDRARNAFPAAGGRNDLAIDVEPGLPLVMADRRRIVQVIGNLLSNAARHSPESAAIEVRAVRVGGDVEVSVVDQGRGIPAEDLPRLFGKFYRRDDHDSTGDTGLGLAICKGIVEAHGGRIRAESEGPGLGARFVFTLPVVRDTEPAHRPARSQGERQSSGTVLVVDDDPIVLRSVRDVLSSVGFQLVVTADPEEALLLVEEHKPRLVLLDLMLPEHDGTELMGDILAISRIPVVFLSAYGKDEVVASVLEQGATDYIVKPFSPTELVARVRAALRRFGQPERPVPAEPFVLGDLTINFTQRRVTVSEQRVPLTPTEFDLLAELAADAGAVVSHDQLLRRAWNPGKPGNLRVLRTHMMRLRRKLGDEAANPKYIFAEPRVGYRMPKRETDGSEQ